MSVTESERERFARAIERIKNSDVDELTKDSAIDALTMSADALGSAPDDRRKDAQANAAIAITLALFASTAPSYTQKAIAIHAADCKFKKSPFGLLSKITMPIAIIVGAVILRADADLLNEIIRRLL